MLFENKATVPSVFFLFFANCYLVQRTACIMKYGVTLKSYTFTPYTLHQYAYSPFCSQPFSKVADKENLSHNQKLL